MVVLLDESRLPDRKILKNVLRRKAARKLTREGPDQE